MNEIINLYNEGYQIKDVSKKLGKHNGSLHFKKSDNKKLEKIFYEPYDIHVLDRKDFRQLHRESGVENRVKTGNPEMAIPSEALQACKEPLETSGICTNLQCNTTLAPDSQTYNDVGDDIVHTVRN